MKVGLIKSMSTYEINEKYKDSIIQLRNSIKKYFDSDFVEIKQYEKTIITNESKFDDKKQHGSCWNNGWIIIKYKNIFKKNTKNLNFILTVEEK